MREDSPAVTCKSPLLVGSGLSSPFASSPSLYTASLASSCKSASPGIPQRLRLHLPDPTDSRARSGQLVLAQNWIAEKGGRGLGCLGGGARNDSHQVLCRFFMCSFARTQPGGSGLERAGSHARSFLVWDTGVAWAETLSLGAWAALAAVQNAIKGKRWKDFAIVSGHMV